MSTYDQPSGWGDLSTAVGRPALLQTAAPHLRPGEKLLGAFVLELDPLLPVYWSVRRDNFHLMRQLYRAIRRPFHGGSWGDGGRGTEGLFWKAVRTTPGVDAPDHDQFLMVLTDHRMLVLAVNWKWKGEPYQADLLLELPSGSYVLRPEVPNSRFTHRFDLAFSDGTWIALSAGWKSRKNEESAPKTIEQITGLLAG